MRRIHYILGGICLVGVACSGEDPEDVQGGEPRQVRGTVVDFQTGAPITGPVSVTTRGLEPQPVVTTGGAEFTLDGVTPHSVFHVLAASPPTHRSTYGDAIEIGDRDLGGLEVAVVAETYLASLAQAFAIQPTASTGVLFAHAVDDQGRGRAGVSAAAFVGPDGALGPYFLDAELRAAPGLTATSSSGWAVFFEVEPGVVGLVAEDGSGYTLDMPLSPVSPAAATIATVRVLDGEDPLPTDVSFAREVRPIFDLRGCDNCHSGNGPGRDLGNLTLDGSVNLIYRELVEETAFAPGAKRVDVQAPARSLVLTMPSSESPPDGHPNVTFTGPTDRDYRTILAWITQGALNN
jgi:hypothetical protein